MRSAMCIGTYNNPKVEPKDYLENWYKVKGVAFVTGQLEKGAAGTPHIQYYLHLKERQRLSWFKKNCQHSHFELVSINNGVEEYCNKEESRIDGPWTFGVKPARLNKKGDLARRNMELAQMGPERAVQEGIIKIVDYLKVKKSLDAYKIATMPRLEKTKLRGIWIWGPPGVGKSRYVRDNFEDIYSKNQNKWWDGYTGQKTVVLDDHDQPCLGHYIKKWMDHYPEVGETKGGNVPLNHDHFIITSNYSIEKLYEKDGEEMIKAIRRRCQVIHMDKTFGDISDHS